jgi:hypothetical protein
MVLAVWLITKGFAVPRSGAYRRHTATPQHDIEGDVIAGRGRAIARGEVDKAARL